MGCALCVDAGPSSGAHEATPAHLRTAALKSLTPVACLRPIPAVVLAPSSVAIASMFLPLGAILWCKGDALRLAVALELTHPEAVVLASTTAAAPALTFLRLVSPAPSTLQVVACSAAWSRLRCLCLSGASCDAADAFPSAPDLTTLRIEATPLPDATATTLLQRCPALTELSLHRVYGLRDATLAVVAAAPLPLTALSIRRAPYVTDAGIAALCGAAFIGRLEQLDLSWCVAVGCSPRISSAALCRFLRCAPRLTALAVCGLPGVDDQVLQTAADHPALTAVRASFCPAVTAAGVEALSFSTRLSVVALSGCPCAFSEAARIRFQRQRCRIEHTQPDETPCEATAAREHLTPKWDRCLELTEPSI